MNTKQAKAFYPLSFSVRRLFHRLGHAITKLHEGSGVSGGMRAVLENVITGGPQTVPQMARIRPVSRQHIQSHVNDLMAEGYVEYVDNPAHRRSKLVQATAKGRRNFESLRKREAEALSRLTLAVTSQELDDAGRVLSRLIETFESAEWEGIIGALSPKSKEQKT